MKTFKKKLIFEISDFSISFFTFDTKTEKIEI